MKGVKEISGSAEDKSMNETEKNKAESGRGGGGKPLGKNRRLMRLVTEWIGIVSGAKIPNLISYPVWKR